MGVEPFLETVWFCGEGEGDKPRCTIMSLFTKFAPHNLAPFWIPQKIMCPNLGRFPIVTNIRRPNLRLSIGEICRHKGDVGAKGLAERIESRRLFCVFRRNAVHNDLSFIIYNKPKGNPVMSVCKYNDPPCNRCH